MELTDIEMYEVAVKILVDKLHVYGYIGFIQQHFKHLNSDQPIDQSQSWSDSDVRLGRTGQIPTAEPPD